MWTDLISRQPVLLQLRSKFFEIHKISQRGISCSLESCTWGNLTLRVADLDFNIFSPSTHYLRRTYLPSTDVDLVDVARTKSLPCFASWWDQSLHLLHEAKAEERSKHELVSKDIQFLSAGTEQNKILTLFCVGLDEKWSCLGLGQLIKLETGLWSVCLMEYPIMFELIQILTSKLGGSVCQM